MRVNTPPFNDPILGAGGTTDTPAWLPQPDGSAPTAKISESWSNYLALLNNQINHTLSDSGYLVPGLPTVSLQKIVNNFGQSIVYNTSLNRMEINNGNRKNPDQRAPSYEPIQTFGSNTTAQINAEAIKTENLGKIFVNSDTNTLQFSLDGTTIRTITST